MRVVVQRVKNASCVIENNIYSEIQKGFLLLVGFTNGDSIKEIKYIAKKIAGFSFGKADILRRAISKKDSELMNSMRNEFIDSAVKNGYTKGTI